ncbi:30S ribosomal protein S5 [candidate division MSBL1 archaeon SCGC-AAA261F19]|uniref:Small ribosomal subunit protein uS5 n=7 Tax=candidate division MSBL1 TaxID=215777 RepID=A0A133UZN2_9EURY|nr:30S ribosomal protein S5 [candidate division MSBL1 archaeon SCGC-AAA261C02]KXB01113.1 30S ribosomal protein S5 [candidate division MSBL1 archaeon SCGC-AAA261F17]KXB02561.1 30S ribosomal protein S5 [candidate division MSBL1 archaeon SCGC-AAA261D19]KXB03030.1 30S ribosomal protein S5 [candidate division MSBL1 archaeon SCGC-AAA261F19]KXB04214.1 30S ribosomal protein S5 [candidate division MSBL1 archaeon SCGC-AAA261G05]KXB04483.1 30S ribosomal protein S5 [candidate division MSBL1 archaeon SCGC-
MENPELEDWIPKTGIGRKVKEGEVTDLSQILRSGKRPREPEIIDALVPDLDEEILGVNLVQRMHRSGRRIQFRVTTVVGNEDGIVGVAHASGREVGPSIRKSITTAKLNVIEIVRGCGSWECGCSRPHSLPYEVSGSKGSVEITLKPAPRGLGLAAAEVPRLILEKAGVGDVWTRTSGKTRTTINFALATFDALNQAAKMEVRGTYAERIQIGEVGEELE